MDPIAILTTGGTFNKVYDPLTGDLIVDPTTHTIDALLSQWKVDLPTHACIGKDSLEMTDADRLHLIECVRKIDVRKIVIVHGTDTIDASARALSDAQLKASIVLTGAMIPWSIDPVEATANLAWAIGALHRCREQGVWIAMHGHFGSYERVVKDRKNGRFILI
jgi:L-asparaginase